MINQSFPPPPGYERERATYNIAFAALAISLGCDPKKVPIVLGMLGTSVIPSEIETIIIDFKRAIDNLG